MTPEEANQLIAYRLQQMVDLLAVIAINTSRNNNMSVETQTKTMQAVAAIQDRKP